MIRMMTHKYKNRPFASELLNDDWFKKAPTTEVDKGIMLEAFKNLSSFNASQKLQQATLSLMVQNMISKEEQGALQKVFLKLDTNNDGYLQYDELLQGYSEMYGDTAKQEVDRIFAQVDIDHSGEIDFSEFVAASVNKNTLLQDEKLKAAFKYFDKDNSGEINVEEIKEVLGGSISTSKEVWDDVLKEVDINGDGGIEFDEFKKMMTKLLQS